MAEKKLPSLTLSAQKKLGIQQAQSINSIGLMSDIVLQLVGIRGSQAELGTLFKNPGDYLEGPGKDDERVHESVRALLNSLAIPSRFGGTPEVYRPFHSALVNSSAASKNFRGIGSTVVGGLLGGRASDVAKKVGEVLANWEHHQVASIFRPFCTAETEPSPEDKSFLREIRNTGGTHVSNWIEKYCAQDWDVWTSVAKGLSIEEQMDSMAMLAGLHLHRLLQIQLEDSLNAGILCFDPDIVNTAPSTSIYAYYRHRVPVFLRRVAEGEVDRISQQHPELASYELEVTRNRWCAQVFFESRSKKESENFRGKFETTLNREVATWMSSRGNTVPITREAAKFAIINAYISTTKNLDKKIVSYFRDTGTIADIVGPATARHKRHLMTPKLLSLLASLHVSRSTTQIETQESEHRSLPAFFDDLRVRYGILISRSQLRPSGLGWESRVPPSLDDNAALVSNALERMGQLRRYSDHSAILV